MLGKRHLYAVCHGSGSEAGQLPRARQCVYYPFVSQDTISWVSPAWGCKPPTLSSDTFPQSKALSVITVVLVTRRSAIHQTLGIPHQSRIGGPMGATNSHFCSSVSWVCIPSYTQPAWAKKCQRKALIWRGWSSLQCIYIIPLNAIY